MEYLNFIFTGSLSLGIEVQSVFPEIVICEITPKFPI